MKYDLHAHSTASDGSLSPTDLLQMAIDEGVELFSVTDHDTIDGYKEIEAYPRPDNLSLLCGIEFSSQWRGVGIHIVGLNINAGCPVLNRAIAQQGQMRADRAKLIDERLAKKGINGVLEGALAINGGRLHNLGRVHMAQYMVEAGHVKSMSKAFDNWLGRGKTGDVKQVWPELEAVIGWINEAGGVAVLAHPTKYKLSTTKLKALIEDFKAHGGRAIEVYSSGMQPAQSDFMIKLANEYGLAASGGSDFHQSGHSWCQLGRVPEMPDSVTPVWTLF